MADSMPNPQSQTQRWAELVTMLSLDVVRPFYDLMGLGTPELTGLEQVLREGMLHDWPIHPPAADPERKFTPELVLRSVAAALGAGAARHLAWWDRHVYSYTPWDNAALDDWDHLLRHCRHEPVRWPRLGFPDSVRDEALDRFLRALDLGEYNRRLKEVDARPLSDWDLHLYALHLWDDNLADESFPGPMPIGPREWILPTVRDYQGYHFWAWVLKALRPDQLDRLWRAGRGIVERDELTSVRELVHPSTLDIGL